MFFKQKTKKSQLAFNMAKIVDAVEKGIALNTIKISGNTVHIFRAIIPADKKKAQSFVKNIFLYTRLKGITKEGQAMFVKDIESDERIAFYQNEKCTLS